MLWALGGIVLWVGGWWFTGRLFGVYTKAIFLEEIDAKREGRERTSPGAHTGLLLFMAFDLGLLLLGIRSIALVEQIASGAADADSLAAKTLDWSLLVCLYLFREGFNLHRFWHDRWRARTGHHLVGQRRPGTAKGLWDETPPAYRILLLLSPLLAAVPLASLLLGTEPERFFYAPPGSHGPFLMWFVLPQGLLLLALSPSLRRARRRAQEA